MTQIIMMCGMGPRDIMIMLKELNDFKLDFLINCATDS